MSRNETAKKILISLYHYFCFFLLMAFLITCCMLLFLSTMSRSMNIEFTGNDINTAAILTFWNVVLLSLVCTVADAIRRRITVDRPVKKIVAAAEQIAKGDYSVRIEPFNSLRRADGLDKIIECYNKMASELSGIETLQTDFISNVSHELKTPLAVIQNYGTLLQNPKLSDEDRSKYAKSVTEASRKLADLVTNILKLNKLENRQIFPDSVNYDLGEQLCESLLGFERIWEEKEIEIETDIEEGVFIKEDPELLSLIWNTLFSHAFKFTEKGGKVGVSMHSDGEHATVKIFDTGCGITPEVGRHMFEKFYQGDTSHASAGNGLGLALVKRVVDIIGGEISVESTPGEGSVFTVRIRRIDDGTLEENR